MTVYEIHFHAQVTAKNFDSIQKKCEDMKAMVLKKDADISFVEIRPKEHSSKS